MATEIKWLMPLGSVDLDERLNFAREQNLGVEIAAFISGKSMNEPVARQQVEAELIRVLSGFDRPITMHGAFMDLILHSTDHSVATLARERIHRDLETAQKLGAEKIVFHLGFNPQITSESYHREVVDRHADFWSRTMETCPGLTICLENQWEEDWQIFGEIFTAVGHPRLGMCLDVAHAHVYSHTSEVSWMRAMATHIRHMHWNDNWGDRDNHLPVGAGNIDWQAIAALCRLWRTISINLELGALDGLRISLAHLQQLGLRPAQRGLASGFCPS